MRDNLIERVLKTVRNYGMVEPGDRLLVAVSGGPDSVFLMHAMLKLKNKLRLKSVAACNLDHGLRGAESKRDSAFVKALARRLGIKCAFRKVDLSRRKAKGLSTEELARKERYSFFGHAARRLGANVIATGHTIDDQAETVMMRVVKGASLKGLAGIAPCREERALRVVRPLVEIPKAEIVSHLERSGIGYRMDSSNLEDKYFRNVVRREILPYLEKYNPQLKRALFNLAQHLREDLDFIEAARSKASGRLSAGEDGSVEIPLKDILVQPRAIQKELLRDSLEKAGGEVKKLSYRHWNDVSALLRSGKSGLSADLPGSIRVTKTRKSIVFLKIKP